MHKQLRLCAAPWRRSSHHYITLRVQHRMKRTSPTLHFTLRRSQCTVTTAVTTLFTGERNITTVFFYGERQKYIYFLFFMETKRREIAINLYHFTLILYTKQERASSSNSVRPILKDSSLQMLFILSCC